MTKKSHEVFGVSPSILPHSYVDRGDLDADIQRLLARPTHIALRGESKCGKSWLRQKNFPNAIAVQCRLRKGVASIYIDALSQLGIKLVVEEHTSKKFSGRIEASTDVGLKLLAKVSGSLKADAEVENSQIAAPVGRSIDDLKFISDLIKESGRRLVIEDFHYLSVTERKDFAFDLKALWDYSLFVIIVGVWSQSNMLIFLNPDLTGRITEVSIYWKEADLKRVLESGAHALNIEFSAEIAKKITSDCIGNVGILQQLAISLLDAAKVYEEQSIHIVINDEKYFQTAAMSYADQLNALYQQFAQRVSNGIRKRKDATGIYAHAMAAIVSTDDEVLLRGLSLDQLFEKTFARQPRTLKGNLRAILEKFEELQVDEDGRGLVIAYNDASSEVTVVDRQLLLYRRYCTVNWPWEQLAAESTTAS